MLMFSAC